MELQVADVKLPVKEYLFIFHYEEDYPSLKECITDVEKSLLEVEEPEWGMVVMVFTDFDKLMLMPVYHTRYFIGDKEITESEALVSNEDVDTVRTVEHKVDYTQGVAGKMRLVIQYCDSIQDRELFEASLRRYTYGR